jgi:hypothetical protein
MSLMHERASPSIGSAHFNYTSLGVDWSAYGTLIRRRFRLAEQTPLQIPETAARSFYPARPQANPYYRESCSANWRGDRTADRGGGCSISA